MGAEAEEDLLIEEMATEGAGDLPEPALAMMSANWSKFRVARSG